MLLDNFSDTPINLEYLKTLIYNPFSLDNDLNDPLIDNDPDSNYFNNTDFVKNMTPNYLTEDSFKTFISLNLPHTDKKTQKSLSIVNFNIRGLECHFDSFTNYLDSLSFKFDIIILTETWTQTADHDRFSVTGYQDPYFVSRTDKKGGGVAIYVSETLMKPTIRIDMNISIDNQLSSIFLEFPNQNSKNMIVGGIYRPPNTNTIKFNNDLEIILSKISSENKISYIAGDFNLDLLKETLHNPTETFLRHLASNGFLPLITKPTRITNTSATLIDNIFTNCLDSQHLTGILFTDISDHLPNFSITASSLHRDSNESNVNQFEFRKINEKSINHFCENLSKLSWEDTLTTTDTNICFSKIYSSITTTFNKSFPKSKSKSKHHSNSNSKPWRTPGLIASFKTKNKLCKKKTNTISVTLFKSPNGALPRHRECVRGLGLRKINHTVVLEDTPSVRGMVKKIEYMVRVEEA